MDWRIFRGEKEPHDDIRRLRQDSPPWRTFEGKEFDYVPEQEDRRAVRRLGHGRDFQVGDEEIDLVNAALYLRRPLLITGCPGIGKSSLPYAVARELKLGRVLRWPITSRSAVKDGLYSYDAIGRLQASGVVGGPADPDIGNYITLGPLGTALLPTPDPQVLLIDEIDKSDVDLPNDLLNVFEDGEFEIPEVSRLPRERIPVHVHVYESDQRVPLTSARIVCQAFPFVVLTSNGERELPPAMMRRCLCLEIKPPSKDKLQAIVRGHFGDNADALLSRCDDLVERFLAQRTESCLATDQLLNALFLASRDAELHAPSGDALIRAVVRSLNV